MNPRVQEPVLTVSFVIYAYDDLALTLWILFYLALSREIFILLSSYGSSEVSCMEKLHLFTKQMWN